MLGLAREARAEDGILRGDSDRAGIEVTLPHHDASHRNQRRRGESELLGSEKRPDDHVSPGLHLPVDLETNAIPKTVQDQGLMHIGDP